VWESEISSGSLTVHFDQQDDRAVDDVTPVGNLRAKFP
jgi:hypothetical protein